MSGVEAVRVMCVLEDMLEGLRLMAYLTPDVVKSTEHLQDVVGQGPADAIQQYKDTLHSRNVKDNIAHDDLLKKTVDIWRAFKKSPGALGQVASLRSQPSEGMLQVIDTMKELKTFAHKKLTTTVEEDKSAQEHFEDVKIREEKAMSEKQQLQQKLKLERIQRQKQVNHMQRAEDQVNSQLSTMKLNHASSMRNMENSTAHNRSTKQDDYSKQKAELESEIDTATKKLEGLRESNNSAEQAIRKSKKKAEQDVEIAVLEYDKELADRQKELEEEETMYTELTAKIEELQAEVKTMKAERIAYEEEKERLRKENQRRALALFIRNRAARVIQNMWSDYNLAKKKAKKKGKKGKDKK